MRWLPCAVLIVGCSPFSSGDFSIDHVDPSSGPNTAVVPVQIDGTFRLPITTSLDQGGSASVVGAMTVTVGETPIADATWQSEQTIAGSIPAGLAVGSYDVTVTIGDRSTTLPNGYTVPGIAVDAAIDAPPRQCDGSGEVNDGEGHCLIYYGSAAVYADARASCVADHTDLVIIRDAVQNAVVQSMIGSSGVSTSNTFLGATDVVQEGVFVWVDGSPLTLGEQPIVPAPGVYNNFSPNEPNNGTAGSANMPGSAGYVENCVVMRADGTGIWDDKACLTEVNDGVDGTYPYVCEFTLQP